EQVGGFDGLFVAAVDEENPLSREADEGNVGDGLGGGGNKCRHFGTCRGTVLRPAGGLADVDEADLAAFEQLREQRSLLDAGDRERSLVGGSGAEFVELGAAELARF